MKFWCHQVSQKANQILDRFLPYEGRAEICLLGDLKTRKIHSEIKLPLAPTGSWDKYLDVYVHTLDCLRLIELHKNVGLKKIKRISFLFILAKKKRMRKWNMRLHFCNLPLNKLTWLSNQNKALRCILVTEMEHHISLFHFTLCWKIHSMKLTRVFSIVYEKSVLSWCNTSKLSHSIVYSWERWWLS